MLSIYKTKILNTIIYIPLKLNLLNKTMYYRSPLFITFSFLLITITLNSQNNYGVLLGGNLATQTFYNPERPQERQPNTIIL